MVAGAAGALLGSVVVATPAAADASGGTTGGTSADGSYCWAVVDTGYTACFATGAARNSAIVQATGNVLQTAEPSTATVPAATRSAIVSDRSGVVPMDDVYLLLTVYKDANYGGGSTIFTTTLAGVCRDYSFSVFSLGSWNDTISSYSPNANNACRVVKAFIDINLQGNWMQTTGDVSNVGRTFNDQISSLWISG